MHIPCLLSDAQPLLQILDWLVALAVANKTINEKVNKRQNRIKLAIFIIIIIILDSSTWARDMVIYVRVNLVILRLANPKAQHSKKNIGEIKNHLELEIQVPSCYPWQIDQVIQGKVNTSVKIFSETFNNWLASWKSPASFVKANKRAQVLSKYCQKWQQTNWRWYLLQFAQQSSHTRKP